MIIERGDIFLVNLEPSMGSEQGKIRPCVVIQNNIGNKTSSTTIVAAITSQPTREYPFMVKVEKGNGNLTKEGTILLNQIRTISSEDRILKKIGSLEPETMKKVDNALKTSLGVE